MQPARTAAQTAVMRPVDSVLWLTSSTIHPAWRPIRRKTVFSRTNAMVRQFIRSAIRDWAVCTTGALCPSSRPAMTTAMTPEAWISSAAMKATKGTTNEIAVSSTGSVISLRSLATMTKTTKPTAAPPSEAMRNSRPTCRASTPTDIAAMAVRSATSAVASLSSDSPSRIVTILRGRPIRRAMAVAATASGGATTAPMAKDTGQEMSGIKACTITPTPSVVNTTRPIDSSRIARRLALKSTSEVWIAAAYSSGGSSPNSTTSGSRWISGTPGTYDPATPTAISSSGAGKSRRSARAVNASTATAMATSRTAISTAPIVSELARTRFVCGSLRDFPLGVADESEEGSGGLGDPAHRVAPAELFEAVLAEREHHEGAPVGGEGEDVGDHPAVREHLGRLAQRVDERVVDAAVVGDVADMGEVRRPLDRETLAHRAQRLVLLDRPVVVAGRHRGVPHAHLADEPAEQGPDRLPVVVDVELDLLVELLVGEALGQANHLAGEPDVVLDHLREQLHGRDLVSCGQPDAAGWVEVDPARRGDLEVSGLLAPGGGRGAVRLLERPGERLVRAVARLDRDVDERRPGGDHPVRRPLQQDASAEGARRLPRDRLDHPVEVEPREVQPQCQLVAGRLMVVQDVDEGVDEGVHELRERVGGDGHGFIVEWSGPPGLISVARAAGCVRRARAGCPAGCVPRRPRCRRWARRAPARAPAASRPASAGCGSPRTGWRGRHRAGCRTAGRNGPRARVHPARGWRRSSHRRR